MPRASARGTVGPRGVSERRPPATAPASREALSRSLLAWYRRTRRDLPWRRARDPYRIWLSEIMLQQTRVDTVIPYFERFLARFPSVQALAEAPMDDVLKLWEGLGYYSRARNLKAAAERVSASGGAFPTTTAGLRELPGVGRYTAGAVASIAFGAAEPAVDGNVERVLARLLAMGED
ncbi:MAG: A/G-specific adenine glycosylase, partial [Candidatus Methylomirabilis sp.]|nr:A/G-specific adenine glycosylase [Deltaproteobacteria bacterium]